MQETVGAIFEQGKGTIKIPVPVYIRSCASVVSKKEGQGPLGELFDLVLEDDKSGADTWEGAESALQREALSLAIEKSGLKKENINLLFAGDLLGQSIASSFGNMNFDIPFVGLYGQRMRPVSPPAIMPVQRRSSASRSIMEISVRCLQRQR